MLTNIKDSYETHCCSTKKDGVIPNKTITFILPSVIYSNSTKPEMFIFKLEQKEKG